MHMGRKFCMGVCPDACRDHPWSACPSHHAYTGEARGALDQWREGSRIDSPREAVRDDREWRTEACLDAKDACLDAKDACREATCRLPTHVMPCFTGTVLQLPLGLSNDPHRRGCCTHGRRIDLCSEAHGEASP